MDNPNALEETLSHLEELIAPLAQPIDHGAAFYFLLLLWSYFFVYQLEPYIGGGEGGDGAVKIIPVTQGWEIHDHGDSLVTSPGKEYGGYSTGKLIRTAEAMIDLLKKRGAKKVAFLGHEIAQRAAWIACKNLGIEVSNYFPTFYDELALERLKWVKEQGDFKILTTLRPE